jgi:hypothetical protein
MPSFLLRAATLGALALGAGLLPAHAAESPLAAALHRLAPAANPTVIELALKATDCAAAQGLPPSDRLAVIDYSLPSTTPRLWVFDLAKHKLLFHELVAHGRNSGANHATQFSDSMNSLQSSLGLFRTLGTFRFEAGRAGWVRVSNDGTEPDKVVIADAVQFLPVAGE